MGVGDARVDITPVWSILRPSWTAGRAPWWARRGGAASPWPSALRSASWATCQTGLC